MREKTTRPIWSLPTSVRVEELYSEIGRLTTHVAWLKKNLVSTRACAERLSLVERQGKALPLAVQAELLGLSRASLYYTAVSPSAAEVALKHRIDEIYTQYPFYGSRRIAVGRRREGHVINRKTVQLKMREMGIAGIAPQPNLSRRNHLHAVYPYLLRGVQVSAPNLSLGH